MGQPHVAQEPVVTLLVQDQLAIASETGVDFAVAVEVGGVVPRSILVVEVEDCAFADVDEETDVLSTSILSC